MKNKKVFTNRKNINTEVGLFVILGIAIFFATLVYFQSKQGYQFGGTINFSRPVAQLSDEDRKVIFASNGTKEIYKLERDGKWFVIIDGQESMPFDFVSTPTFNADGSQFAYSAAINGKYFIVINNVPSKNTYTNIGGIAFSPDGQRLAYIANKGEKFVVVLDEKESKSYQEVDKLETSTGETYFVFSQDSQQLAFKVTENQQSFIVVNNQEGKRYDDVSNFAFTENGQYTYQAQQDGEKITVVNQQEVVNNTANNNNGTNTTTTNNNQTNTSSGTTNSGQIIKYKRNSRDLNLDPDRLQYSTCGNSGSCNF